MSRPRLALTLALALTALAAVPATAPAKLGPAPTDCKVFPPETPTCVIGSRYGHVVVTPAIVRAGQSLHATFVSNCGVECITGITWPSIDGAKVVSGCTAGSFHCYMRIPKNAPDSDWQGYDVSFGTPQGGAVTQDFFATIGRDKTAIEGYVYKEDAPAPEVSIVINGKKVSARLRTNDDGYYNGVFKRGDYAVAINDGDACAVGEPGCVSSKLVGKSGSKQVDFKITPCPPPGLRAGCVMRTADFPADRQPVLVVADTTGPVQIKRVGVAGWKPAKPGDVLGPGDELRSGAAGYATLASAHRMTGPTDQIGPYAPARPLIDGQEGQIELDRYGSLSAPDARLPEKAAAGAMLDNNLIDVGPSSHLAGNADQMTGHVTWFDKPDWSDVREAQWNKTIDDELTLMGRQHRFRPHVQAQPGGARG